TAREADRLRHQHEAHDTRRERGADAGAVGKHQVALQLDQAIVRDARLRKLAESGIDAINRSIAVGDVLHDGQGGLQRRHHRIVEGDVDVVAVDAPQVAERYRTRAEAQRRMPSYAGTVHRHQGRRLGAGTPVAGSSASVHRRTSALSMPNRSRTRPTLWLTISS